MICIANRKEGAEILLDYIHGTLDAARKIELDRHVESCAECRRLVDAQRTVYAALEDWSAPEVSADFDQRLYARIAAEKPTFWRSMFWQRWLPVTPIVWWKPVVPVALAALALSAIFVVRTSNPTFPASAAQKQMSIGKADLDQVEQALDDMDLLVPATPSSVM
jgi:anti-sigma factor RsiW